MKKIFSVILAFAMLAACLTACSAEDYIAKGDASKANGNYEYALDYYAKAGESGREKMKALHLEIAEDQMEEEGKEDSGKVYSKGTTYLKKNAANIFTEDEIEQAVLDIIAEDLTQMQADLEQKMAENEANGSALTDGEKTLYWRNLDNMKSVLEKTDKSKYPEVPQMLNQMHYLDGLSELAVGGPDYADSMCWFDAINRWENCTEGLGYDLVNATWMVQQGNFAEGYEAMCALLAREEMAMNLYLYASRELAKYGQFNTVSDILTHNTIVAKAQKASEISLEDAFAGVNVLIAGYRSMDNSVNLSEEMVAELQSACGTVPEGKVLILHVTGYSGVDFCTELMDKLPADLYPQNLASVSYVVLIDGKYERTGMEYQGGTAQIKELTTVLVYDLTTGEEITLGTAEGPVSMIMSYTGAPPAIYSAGAPNAGDLLKEAIRVISDKIDNQ